MTTPELIRELNDLKHDLLNEIDYKTKQKHLLEHIDRKRRHFKSVVAAIRLLSAPPRRKP